MEGWIKLHRQIQENEFYFTERFTRSQAWIDLLIMANHKPNTIFIRGNEIQVKEGELCYSQLTLSKRWKWNQRTVNKFLKALENRQMIQTRITYITTIITILNWGFYQGSAEQSAEQNTKQNKNRIQTDKNDKNVKNEKKVFTPPSIQELVDFFKEKGYTEESAKKAHEYYTAHDWHDSNGKKIKNWKQKMIGVWFKEENKIPKVSNISGL